MRGIPERHAKHGLLADRLCAGWIWVTSIVCIQCRMIETMIMMLGRDACTNTAIAVPVARKRVYSLCWSLPSPSSSGRGTSIQNLCAQLSGTTLIIILSIATVLNPKPCCRCFCFESVPSRGSSGVSGPILKTSLLRIGSSCGQFDLGGQSCSIELPGAMLGCNISP